MSEVNCLQSLLSTQLSRAFEAKQTTRGLVGLGYVGLSLAHAAIRAGLPLLGFDIDARKVEQLR